MQSPQVEQTTFITAVPRLVVNDIVQSLAFYGQLGFEEVRSDPDFAIVKRDEVYLHMSRHPIDPKESLCVCWIVVSGIEALYHECIALNLVPPNSPLSVQPWNFREFDLIDPSGVLLIFAEPVA